MYKTKKLFKYLNHIIFFSFICFCFNSNIFGIGTVQIKGQEYYKIYNEDDLFEFAKIVNGCSEYRRHYPQLEANAILMDDICGTQSKRWNPIAYDSILKNYRTKTNISFTGKPIVDPIDRGYEGTFDGNNHTISNLYCISEISNNVGLFGKIGPNGVVKNLIIQNFNFSGQHGKTSSGLICGQNYGSILHCLIINQNQNITCVYRQNTGEVLVRFQYPNLNKPKPH